MNMTVQGCIANNSFSRGAHTYELSSLLSIPTTAQMTSNSKGLPRQACAVQEDSLWVGCSLSVVGVRNNFDIVIWSKSSCPQDPPHDLWHLFVSATFRAATLQARRSSAVLQSGTSHANRDMSACADGPWNNETVGRLLAHLPTCMWALGHDDGAMPAPPGHDCCLCHHQPLDCCLCQQQALDHGLQDGHKE